MDTTLVYQAKVRFEATGTLKAATVPSGIGFKFSLGGGTRLEGSAGLIQRSLLGGEQVHRGETGTIIGSMVGEKFENGWKFSIRPAKVSIAQEASIREEVEKPDPQPTQASRESAPKQKQEADRFHECVNHLRNIALAFRLFAADNDDNFPFNLSTANGGTLELCKKGDDSFEVNSIPNFKLLAKDLGSTILLVCPSDPNKKASASFPALTSVNISYRLKTGSEVSESYPDEMLAWCPIHQLRVNCDGSVIKGKGEEAQQPAGPRSDP